MTTQPTHHIPPGYKLTELGVIPADWEVKEIGNLLKVKHGKSQKQIEAKDGKYSILATGGVIGSTNTFLYNKPSVLIGRKGTIDKPQYIDKPFWTVDTLFYTEIYSRIDAKFMFYKISSIDRYKYNEASGVPSLNARTIEGVNIIIPSSFHEQQAIATALSDIDTLITSLDDLIAKKQAIKQGTMQHLLTGKKRLPGFSGKWEEHKLGDIVNFYKGRGLAKSTLSKSGRYKCIHYGELFTKYHELIGKIKSSTNDNINSFFSKHNDVLMPTSDVTPNGLATASCVKEDGVILGGDILVIRPFENILDGVFLSYYIAQEKSQVMQLVSGTTVYHLYASDMSKFVIKYPNIKEQLKIIEVLLDMDAEIESLQAQQAKYKDIKQGMMQQLLTGKIRLIDTHTT